MSYKASELWRGKAGGSLKPSSEWTQEQEGRHKILKCFVDIPAAVGGIGCPKGSDIDNFRDWGWREIILTIIKITKPSKNKTNERMDTELTYVK